MYTWFQKFLSTHQLKQPDRRPLYAYRCSPDKYEELSQLLAQYSNINGTISQLHAALFCLFAADADRHGERSEGG